MWWYETGPGWAGWLLMALAVVAFWGILAAVVVLLTRWMGSSSEPGPQTPEQILAQRFARGEISEAEYHRALDALKGRHETPV